MSSSQIEDVTRKRTIRIIPKSHSSPSNPLSSQNEEPNQFFNLPIDCLGEIFLFFNSSYDFMNIITLSKEIHHYIINENPKCCENMIFKLTYSNELKNNIQKKFVYKLILKPFFAFDQTKKSEFWWESGSNYNNYNGRIIDKKSLQEHLSYFPNLMGLRFMNMSISGGTFFENLVKIEDLCFDTCNGVRGKKWGDMMNLKMLEIVWCSETLKSGIFKDLKKLEKLKIQSVSFVPDDGDKNFVLICSKNLKELTLLSVITEFRVVSKLKRFTIHASVYNFMAQIKLLDELDYLDCRFIPYIHDFHVDEMISLKVLSIENCLNIKGNWKSKLLLEDLYFGLNDKIHDDVFKKLDKLRVLSINKCVNIRGINWNMVNLTELKIWNQKHLTSEIFENMKSLQKLEFFNCTKITLDHLDQVSLKFLSVESSSSLSDSSNMGFNVFKQLEVLHIKKCQGIKGKPLKIKLKELVISDQHEISDNFFNNVVTLQVLKLNNCSKITGKYWNKLGNLHELEIKGQKKITDDIFIYLNSLEKLCIDRCKKIKFKKWDNLLFLNELIIKNQKIRKGMSKKTLKHLVNLTTLIID